MVVLLIGALVAILSGVIILGIQTVGALLLNFLYWICKWLLTFIDFCETFMRRLCGLAPVTIDGVGDQDILFDMVLGNENIRLALLAILALSIILVFGFALVQIIRLQYTTEGSKNAVGPIIKTCIKSIFLFCLIPFCSFLGVFVGNQLLGVVDAATNHQDTGIAGTLFLVSVSDANPWRRLENNPGDNPVEWVAPGTDFLNGALANTIIPSGYEYDSETGIISKGNYTTEGMRKVYFSGNQIKGAEYVNSNWTSMTADQLDKYFSKSSETAERVQKTNNDKATTLKNGDLLNYTDTDAVYYFYNMRHINYFMLILGSYFAFQTMLSVIFGLAMRLYKIAVLFIISPFPVAMTVLDDGSALGKWKNKFMGELFSTYGVVVGFNLFRLLIVEFNNKLTVFSSGEIGPLTGLFNNLCQLVLVLVGCMMIKDIVGIISELIGGADVIGAGEGMKKQVGEAAMKAGSVAMGGLTLAAAGATSIVGLGRAAFNKHRANKFNEKHGGEIKEATDNAITEGKEAKKHEDAANQYQQQIDLLKNDPNNIAKSGKNKGKPKADIQRKIDDLAAKKQQEQQQANIHRENESTHLATVNRLTDKEHSYKLKMQKGMASALRGGSLIKNATMGTKAFDYINKGTMGMLTADGRGKLDKQISEKNDDYGAILGALAKEKEDRQQGQVRTSRSREIGRDSNGKPIYSHMTDVANKGNLFSRWNAFAEGQVIGKDVQDVVVKNLDAQTVTSNYQKVDNAVNTDVRTLSDDARKFIASDDFLSNANIFAKNDAAREGAKEYAEAIAESLSHEKGSTAYNNAMTKAEAAQQKMQLSGGFIKIDADSINALKRAVKEGVMPSDIRKGYGQQMERLIGKAIEQASTKTQNTKGDSKTANSIQELLRDMLIELKRKK